MSPAPRTAPRTTETSEEPSAEGLSHDSTASGGLLVRVSWSDGTPAEGVRLALRLGRSGLPRAGLAEVVTDARGEAHADGLPVGPVQVVADRGAGAKAQVIGGEVVEVEVVVFDRQGELVGRAPLAHPGPSR